MDAISHAVETAVTRKRNALSLMYSREAFRLVAGAFPEVMRRPGDLEARGRMLLGAALAGTAIENSMLGAAHSAANPLTAHFGIAHGHAVGLMLPHVVRFNAHEPSIAKVYAELGRAANLAPRAETEEVAADHLAERLEQFMDIAQLTRSLKTLGVQPKDIPRLAAEAASQWTAQFNPRTVAAADFEGLYMEALNG